MVLRSDVDWWRNRIPKLNETYLYVDVWFGFCLVISPERRSNMTSLPCYPPYSFVLVSISKLPFKLWRDKQARVLLMLLLRSRLMTRQNPNQTSTYNLNSRLILELWDITTEVIVQLHIDAFFTAVTKRKLYWV